MAKISELREGDIIEMSEEEALEMCLVQEETLKEENAEE